MKNKRPKFDLILFTSKELADGSSPVMIRAYYDRKRQYYSLGLSATEDRWDSKSGRYSVPKGKKLTEVERRANNLLLSYDSKLRDMDDYFRNTSFTFSRFEKKYFNASGIDVYRYISNWDSDLKKFADETSIVKELESQGRLGSASTYKDTLSRLKAFHPKGITFFDIDVKFLNNFEIFLSKTCGKSTIGIYMRTLRAIYNRAITDNIVSKDMYPFLEYKLKTVKGRKKALSKDQLSIIKKYKTRKKSQMWHSLNLFLFSYYARGMNMTDMANLKWKDIRNDRIFYSRQKTSDLIDLKIDDNLAKILANYSGNDGYIFPILDEGLPLKTQRYRIKAKLKKVNADLKSIALETGLSEDITFYWGRHTYATTLKREGVSISVISETLGHSSEQVTKSYLDSFETDQLDKISELL